MKSDIIYAPVITEKSSNIASDGKTYVFKVASVNTRNTKPKDKRVGKYTGQRKTYKKAIITLCDGYSIEL